MENNLKHALLKTEHGYTITPITTPNTKFIHHLFIFHLCIPSFPTMNNVTYYVPSSQSYR